MQRIEMKERTGPKLVCIIHINKYFTHRSQAFTNNLNLLLFTIIYSLLYVKTCPGWPILHQGRLIRRIDFS